MSIYIVSMDTSINIIPSINFLNKKIRGELVIAAAKAFSPIIHFLLKMRVSTALCTLLTGNIF